MPAAAAQAGRPGVIEIYRRSLKPNDLRFNNYACRPLAAVFVYLLYSTRATPNQITFLSLFVALLADAALLGCPGRVGLAAAALLLYLSFVLDCTDGQLARVTGQSSNVGSYLDFLMDEIKAVALIAAVAGRLAIDQMALPGLSDAGLPANIAWLAFGLFGVVMAASGCSMTTFMRRPEYFESVTGQKSERVPGFTALRAATVQEPAESPLPLAGEGQGEGAVARSPSPNLSRERERGRSSPLRKLILLPIRVVEWLGKLTLHYPAWFYIPALLGHIEWFLIPYVAAHTLYLGRSGLVVLVKLGRPRKR